MPAHRQLSLLVVSLLAVGLLLPTAANCGVGVPRWWAPIPAWTFLLRTSLLPAPIVAALPSLLFLAFVLPTGAWRRTRRNLLLSWLGLSGLGHLAWHAWLFREGLTRYGATHAVFVISAGSLLLVAAAVLASRGAGSQSERQFVLSAWLAALWTGWMSVPWFFGLV